MRYSILKIKSEQNAVKKVIHRDYRKTMVYQKVRVSTCKVGSIKIYAKRTIVEMDHKIKKSPNKSRV